MLCTARTSWRRFPQWLCLTCSTLPTGNPPMWSPSFCDRYIQSKSHPSPYQILQKKKKKYFILLCIFKVKELKCFTLPDYCSPHAREIKFVLHYKMAGRKILNTLFSQFLPILYQKNLFACSSCYVPNSSPLLPLGLFCWKFWFTQRTVSYSNMPFFIHISRTSGWEKNKCGTSFTFRDIWRSNHDVLLNADVRLLHLRVPNANSTSIKFILKKMSQHRWGGSIQFRQIIAQSLYLSECSSFIIVFACMKER